MSRPRLVVHAHFYQPFRADPFSGRVPPDPTAAPFRDWNERVTAECYRPNAQLGTLEVLYYLGPMCQSDIGNKLLVTGGNMTMVINNLEKRGLVSRQRDPDDRRQITVSLTEQGQQLIGELFPRHAQNISKLMNVLSPTELEELGRLCKILGRQEKTE